MFALRLRTLAPSFRPTELNASVLGRHRRKGRKWQGEPEMQLRGRGSKWGDVAKDEKR